TGQYIPLLAKEGWPRHQKNWSRSDKARTGWSLTSQVPCERPPRLRRFGGFATYNYCPSHPSFARRGVGPSFTTFFPASRFPASRLTLHPGRYTLSPKFGITQRSKKRQRCLIAVVQFHREEWKWNAFTSLCCWHSSVS